MDPSFNSKRPVFRGPGNPSRSSDRSPANQAHPAVYLKVDTPSAGQSFSVHEDIYVSGWVAANEPLAGVAVEVAGEQYRAQTGIHRPDLLRAFPGVPALERAGFAATIRPPKPAGEMAQPVEVKVTATAVSGILKTEVVELFFATSAHSEVPKVSPDEAMKLVVDQAIVTQDGLLKVVGWCACLGRLGSVTLSLDDDELGKAEIELKRPDVAESWPNYSNSLNSGFRFNADVSAFAGKRTLIVRSRSEAGVSREVRRSVEIIAPVSPQVLDEVHRFECDAVSLSSAGDLAIKGWAASSSDIKHILVKLDDHELGYLERGIDRPDVGNQFPSLPQARRSGFDFAARVAPGRLKDEHLIRFEMALADGSIRHYRQAVATQAVERVSAAPVASSPAILLHLDVPAVADGRALKEISSGLSLSGWALAQDGIDRIEILMNDEIVGRTTCGMRRRDVAQAFPGWEGALLSGFGFSLPRRLLKAGQHRVAIHAIGKASSRTKFEFAIDVADGGREDGPSFLRQRIGEAERRLQTRLIERFRLKPWFDIAVQLRNVDIGTLRHTIRSLVSGTYEQWSVTVVCDHDHHAVIEQAIRSEWPALDDRISVRRERTDRPSPGQPLWHMRLVAGDLLSVDALFEFACAINEDADVEFIYGDDRRLVPEEGLEAYFKPDWSPDLLSSQNYIGRAFCVSDRLFRECTVNEDAARSSYDLVLNCTGRTSAIAHVKRVICEHATAVSASGDLDVLRAWAVRETRDVTVSPGLTAGTFRLRPRKLQKDLVSIIIPTCAAGGLIETCLATLREKSTYQHLEIICVDNIKEPSSPWKSWLRDHADVVVEITEPFNWSRFNNIAAAEASGSVLLFLNDDIEIIEPDWLKTMLEIVAREDVGAVGPQLLYPDGRVQHAGLFLAKPGLARHAFRFQGAEDPGYFDLALSQRNVIAVTGACLMVRREIFERLGGFDESHAVINNDLDFCLKCHAAGLWNVYTPFAKLVHHELVSRAMLKDDHDSTHFEQRWDGVFAKGDPFFHPELDHHSDAWEPEAEPVRVAVGGGPLYRADSIKKILAVKVDHIGDFITAFPAFRKLKAEFPNASLHVLAAPASRALGGLEPAIDEIIPFAFFHARSSLGQNQLDPEALTALRKQLEPYEFDLAIDFRKHSETRTLLQQTGAKLTAGYDYQNQFPWLDIALQWEGDSAFVTKRQHISEDLINLVDAVVAAGVPPQAIIRSPSFGRDLQLALDLRETGFTSKPVICVHPAAGGDLKQWPPAYFASLINLLIQAEDVNVAIVGGPDEAELGERVMAGVRHPPDRVLNLIGRLKLDELATFVASCALFVGNDSGPKHMAAALGVPTIGIQSGIVDAQEWGPSGEIAIAIKREVSCAPCYVARREDCHRNVACLTGIAPGVVFEACQRLLGRGRAGKRRAFDFV